jgi:hypothetical protein
VHSLVWVQREKEGLPLPPTPKDTSNNTYGEGWSLIEVEEEEEEMSLAVGAKGKEVLLNLRPRRRELLPLLSPWRVRR